MSTGFSKMKSARQRVAVDLAELELVAREPMIEGRDMPLMITPVVRGANKKGIAEIAKEVKELAARARDKKLAPEEYTGATFSISNLGMFGIKEFTAIINPPEAAIFAIGAAAPTPVVRDGEIVVRQIMHVTMSCDHRVIDGATGAKFLQTFKQMLENPILMLM